ncbi:hypothetical protein CA13_14860 [Planctomycetes bacterium CA13]|uniref:SnoaL-like domain-containing protein n=1 Tax=Novipirellula herctigrandis TaxID=2527986 RepID=A0A5C5Z068_9BACT|nr:hypothetical protein CA13_14860 [Planctomycetes bacterium CA13]
MNYRIPLLSLALVAVLGGGRLLADDVEPNNTATPNAVMDRIAAAYQQDDLAAMLDEFSDDAAITWYSAETSHRNEDFIEIHKRLYSGEASSVENVDHEMNVDDGFIVVDDNTAIVEGTIADHFTLEDRSEFTLESHWTATLGQQDADWQVVSFQATANIFNNPMLNQAKGSLATSMLAAGLGGILLGFVCGRLSAKHRR